MTLKFFNFNKINFQKILILYKIQNIKNIGNFKIYVPLLDKSILLFNNYNYKL